MKQLHTSVSLLIVLTLLPLTSWAQQTDPQPPFHLDVAGIVGTRKVGVELSTPITTDVTLRAGATFFTMTDKTGISLPIQTGEADPDLSAAENLMLFNDRFNKVNEFISQFSGYDMDSQVKMQSKMSHTNFHLIADITPLRNKHWFVSAGFYYGNSEVTEVVNHKSHTSTLMGMSIWNSMYQKVMAEEPIINHKGIAVYLPYDFEEAIRTEYGEMAMVAGTYKRDIVATEDIAWDYSAYDPITGDVLHQEGDVRYHKGDIIHHKGDTYYLEPNSVNMFRLTQHVSKLKPYIGAGYRGRLTKNGRSQILVDMGVMYISKNHITFHDGMRLGRDVTSPLADDVEYGILRGSHFEPSLSVRITYRLF